MTASGVGAQGAETITRCARDESSRSHPAETSAMLASTKSSSIPAVAPGLAVPGHQTRVRSGPPVARRRRSASGCGSGVTVMPEGSALSAEKGKAHHARRLCTGRITASPAAVHNRSPWTTTIRRCCRFLKRPRRSSSVTSEHSSRSPMS